MFGLEERKRKTMRKNLVHISHVTVFDFVEYHEAVHAPFAVRDASRRNISKIRNCFSPDLNVVAFPDSKEEKDMKKKIGSIET